VHPAYLCNYYGNDQYREVVNGKGDFIIHGDLFSAWLGMDLGINQALSSVANPKCT